MKGSVKINCFQCSKEIYLHPSEIKAGRKCCSHACSKQYLWGKEEYKTLMSNAHKGKRPANLDELIRMSRLSHGNREKQIGRTPWNKGLTGLGGYKWTEENKKKLSLALKGKKRPNKTGEKNHKWIKDRTQLAKYKNGNEYRNSPASREWSRQVKNRDGWRCMLSDENCAGRMESHHILIWSLYPEERYNINNGITLCHAHHPHKRTDEERLIPVFKKLVGSNTN